MHEELSSLNYINICRLFKKIKTKVVQCYSRTAPSSDDPDINLRPAPLRFLSRSNNENNNNVDSNASR